MLLIPIFIFLLGLIIGSFLNVVIYRYNSSLSINGRSRCLSCGKKLSWYELVPVFSFLIQGGRCRGCKSKISWQYPAVELVTGLVFLVTWQLNLVFVSKIIYLIIFSLLIAISGYDLRHKIIPDGLVFSFIALALLNAILTGALVPNLITGLVLAAFFWILWLVSRGRWMGFGDGKLALGVGLLAGPAGGVSSIVTAFWIGAAAGLILITISRLWPRARYFTIKSELPFAPFIILGLVLYIFFNINVLALFNF